MGFPPCSWFGHRTMGMQPFPVLYRGRGRGRTRPTSRTSGRSRVILGTSHPLVAARPSRADLRGPGLDHPGPAASPGAHPGQARGGVDTVWQGPAVTWIGSRCCPAVGRTGRRRARR